MNAELTEISNQRSESNTMGINLNSNVEYPVLWVARENLLQQLNYQNERLAQEEQDRLEEENEDEEDLIQEQEEEDDQEDWATEDWPEQREESNVYYDEDGRITCGACGAYAEDEDEPNDTDPESEGQATDAPEWQAHLGRLTAPHTRS